MSFDIFDPDPQNELFTALEANNMDTAGRLVKALSRQAHEFSVHAERDPNTSRDQLYKIWHRVIYISDLAGDSMQADLYRLKLCLKEMEDEENDKEAVN